MLKRLMILILLLTIPLANAQYELEILSASKEVNEGKVLKVKYKVSENNNTLDDMDPVNLVLYCNDLEPKITQEVMPIIVDKEQGIFLLGLRIQEDTVRENKLSETCSLYIDAQEDEIKDSYVENVLIKRKASVSSVMLAFIDWFKEAGSWFDDLLYGPREIN